MNRFRKHKRNDNYRQKGYLLVLSIFVLNFLFINLTSTFLENPDTEYVSMMTSDQKEKQEGEEKNSHNPEEQEKDDFKHTYLHFVTMINPNNTSNYDGISLGWVLYGEIQTPPPEINWL